MGVYQYHCSCISFIVYILCLFNLFPPPLFVVFYLYEDSMIEHHAFFSDRESLKENFNEQNIMSHLTMISKKRK